MSEELSRKVEIEELIQDLSTKDRLLQLDALLINSEQVDCPLDNQFTPNLYIRERFVPAGTLFTTYTWKIEHPFFCSIGELLIWDETNGWQLFAAPCRGLTKAGTKRIVYAITDVCWSTYHYNPTDTHDIAELEHMLFEKYENPYLSLSKLK